MAHVTLGNSFSSKRVTKGCPQGSDSGPTLWNIIISGLTALLSNAPNLKIVVFANDIMITMQGTSLPAIFTTLQTSLQIREEWCKEHRLEISKDKSALMPMFTTNSEEYKCHPTTVAWGIKLVSKMRYLEVMLDCKLDWYPHAQYLDNKFLHIHNSLVRCSKATWGMSFYNLMTAYTYTILPAITYVSEAWSTLISKRAKSKLQQVQRSFLVLITKAYRRVSHKALSAIAGIMPIDQAMHLYKDIRAISRSKTTNTVINELKKIKIPIKTRGIHPKDNHIRVDLSGTEGNTNVSIYTDGSKTKSRQGKYGCSQRLQGNTH
jgi:hypothetical protein